MKYSLYSLFIFFLLLVGYIIYEDYRIENTYNSIQVEEETININKYYVYGTHLNINGEVRSDIGDDISIVIYNGDTFNVVDSIYENGIISFSSYINDGLYLDSLEVGKYYLFLRTSSTLEDGTISYKYYSIRNNTSYDSVTYYTFSNVGNKIVINFNNKYNTLAFNVGENHDEGVYDVIVDAGHGGKDEGASGNGYDEIDFTIEYANLLLKKLQDLGYKARLTWYSDEVNSDEKISEYGHGGRAVIPNEVHAKYVISIHINSGYRSASGIEVYTASGINYDFARDIANNIVNYTGIGVSPNKINKYYEGVYSRNFTEDDIAISIKEAEEEGRQSYDITTSSSYYYMIREVGGMITGAYIDDRNSDIPQNYYYNSNIGCESYLLELGYITNENDVNILLNKKDEYINAISDAIVQNLERMKLEANEIH